MDLNASEEDFALAIHSISEAMLVAKTVAFSVMGAGHPPVGATNSASPPQPPTAPPLSKSAKAKARQSDAARQKANVKRAEFLRTKANSLDPESADKNDVHDSGATRAASHTATNTMSPPSTPTKHQTISHLEPSMVHAQASESVDLDPTGQHKRGLDARSPVQMTNSPSSTPSDAKRAHGPTFR